jgi:putative phosphoesterase
MSVRRVAALYDVHGNAAALQAVLEEVRRSSVDVLVFGGDLAWGPFPRETMSLITSLREPTLFVRGNADREVTGRYDESRGLDAPSAEVNLWCADQLSEAHLAFLSELPETAVLELEGLGQILFCHGSPRSDEELISPATPDERVADMVSDVEQNVIVCGHTHMQLDKTVAGKRIVNAGSVGMPYEGRPGAYWALLGPDVALRRTLYDFGQASGSISTSPCPHAAELAANVLDAPSREEAQAHGLR